MWVFNLCNGGKKNMEKYMQEKKRFLVFSHRPSATFCSASANNLFHASLKKYAIFRKCVKLLTR